jgi:hypothetical protein
MLTLTTLNLSPLINTVPLWQSVVLTVTGSDQNGNPIAVPAGLTWRSSNPSAVTVDSTREATVVSSNSGIAEITVSYGDITSNPVIVKPSPTSLTVTPSSASLIVGGSTQFEVKDQNNQSIFDGYWSSSNASVVSINSLIGLATANSIGSATISVWRNPLRSSPVNVTVVSGPPTVNISSTRTEPVPGENYTVSWSSTNASLCSVTNGLTELWSCNTLTACNAGSNITVRAPSTPATVTYTITCHGTSPVTRSVTVRQTSWY